MQIVNNGQTIEHPLSQTEYSITPGVSFTYKDDGGDSNYSNDASNCVIFHLKDNPVLKIFVNSSDFEHSSSYGWDYLGISVSSDNTNWVDASIKGFQSTNDPFPQLPVTWADSENGYIFPDTSTTSNVNGTTYANPITINSKYVRFCFYSDASVTQSGWNFTLNVPLPLNLRANSLGEILVDFKISSFIGETSYEIKLDDETPETIDEESTKILNVRQGGGTSTGEITSIISEKQVSANYQWKSHNEFNNEFNIVKWQYGNTFTSEGTTLWDISPSYRGQLLLSEASLALTIGKEYYFNAFDVYHDGWSGNTYDVKADNFIVINNGGDVPNSGKDSGSYRLETSEGFTVPYVYTDKNKGDTHTIIVTNTTSKEYYEATITIPLLDEVSASSGGLIQPTVTGGGSGDPYIYPINGNVYKMPNNVAFYRFLEFDDVIINVDITNLTRQEKEIIIDVSKEFNIHNPEINGVYFNQFFIKIKDEYVLVDRYLNIISTNIDASSSITISPNDKEQMFDCPIQGTSSYTSLEIKFDDIFIDLHKYSNPQMINGIVVHLTKNKQIYGLMASDANPRYSRIKKVTYTHPLKAVSCHKQYKKIFNENWIKIKT